MKKRVYIENMGCVKRSLDSGRFANFFTTNGFALTGSPQRADYILLITCAFMKRHEENVMQRIEELRGHKAELIVGGCIKAINGARLNKNFKGHAFSTSDPEAIDALFPAFKIKFKDIPDINYLYRYNLVQVIKNYLETVRFNLSYFKSLKYSLMRIDKRYYYIRICWGCAGPYCTYCSIWRAIGPLKSKPIDQCLDEFNKGFARGFTRFIILADNVGAYGLDSDAVFPALLSAFLKKSGNYTLEIEEIHPRWLMLYADELVNLLNNDKITHITCPLQSGNDRILKLMNRGHTALDLKEVLLKIKKANPRLAFTTHIIAGFPTETESEFWETVCLVKDIGFDYVKIYPCSENTAMASSELSLSKIPDTIINKRIHKAIRFFTKHDIKCARQ